MTNKRELCLPTIRCHVGTSWWFNWIKYSITFVCTLLTAKWITVYPDASLYATFAPKETKHFTASNAPDVAANRSGVDWWLWIRKNLCSCVLNLFFDN